MKTAPINPQVRQIIDECCKKLEKISQEKEEELEELVETHVEDKFLILKNVEKKFKVKIELTQD